MAMTARCPGATNPMAPGTASVIPNAGGGDYERSLPPSVLEIFLGAHAAE
ncbi:MAG TPA: hypothetical protein VIJ07_24025 [Dermatophilaceae bacterium]